MKLKGDKQEHRQNDLDRKRQLQRPDEASREVQPGQAEDELGNGSSPDWTRGRSLAAGIPPIRTFELLQIRQTIFRQLAGIALASLRQGAEVTTDLLAGLEIEIPAVGSHNGGQNVGHGSTFEVLQRTIPRAASQLDLVARVYLSPLQLLFRMAPPQ